MINVEPQAALLFSIGPVQDFIATARKGQDLWFGSWMLSDLARTAAKTAQERGAMLIMPSPVSLDDQSAIANKVLARVDARDAVTVANAVEGAVRAKLADLAESVFDRIANEAEGKYLRGDNANAQVADLPEIAWVVVDDVADDWGETRRRAEAALAARKSLRDFGPVTWGAPVPKSRLDGQRESVIDEAAFPKANQNGRAERLRKIFGVGPAERLCGVGLLKRNGRHALASQEARGARVVSTAHVASWSLRRVWHELPAAQAALKQAFDQFLADLPDQGKSQSQVPCGHEDPVLGKVDGAVLFTEQLAEDYDAGDLATARRLLSGFMRDARRLVEQQGGLWPNLSPYYAVMCADGDRMGEWLNGLTAPQDHQRASKTLADFASAAEGIVKAHHGHCVFAGGDDVLALLPVATALDCAAALNEAFANFISKGPKGSGAFPTLSVGIQIAHVIEPFRGSLEGARSAEYAAKHTYGRAAFAVRLDKRSGVPLLIGGKWEELASIHALQELQEPGVGILPRGLAYDLRRVAERLTVKHLALKANSALEVDLEINRKKAAAENATLNAIRALQVDRVLKQKDVEQAASSAVWARLGNRDLSAIRLERTCDELTVTRVLAALDGEAL